MVKITPAIDTTLFCQHRVIKRHNPVKIITVGRLTWKKGIEYALQALAQLSGGFSYILIGDGEDSERLKYAAYQLGITDKVIFLGKLPHDEIVRYLQDADIYLQPSVQEGFCNAVIEAQAVGLPCVVTDAEGLSENVEDGRTGFVVPRRDSVAMRDAIQKIMEMPDDELQTMADYSVDRAKRLFDVKDQINKFIQFFD